MPASTGLVGALASSARKRADAEMIDRPPTRRALPLEANRRSYASGMKSPSVDTERPRLADRTPEPERTVIE